jgi:DNA-directed RNA polymerase sigma subunit (sigma70/sigma32)
MYAAMRELFSSVNARSSFTSLDATIDEDGETTLYDMLADPCGGDPAERTADVLSDPIWNMFTDMERACLLLKEGIVDGEALSYTQVGERLGVEWTEVRKHVASAKTKVVAPHAQYAYLSGSAEHQFEDNEKPHSAIERLRRRTVTTH